MLLVGTKNELLDLDRGRTLVDGHAVTALDRGPRVWLTGGCRKLGNCL
jgi:hypothetical protein